MRLSSIGLAMSVDVPPEAVKAMPGVLGAISGVLIAPRERWKQAAAMIVPSAALSWYGGEHIAHWWHMPEGLAGFLVGLLGMAVIAKVLKTWDDFDLGPIFRDALRQLFRLPPKQDDHGGQP